MLLENLMKLALCLAGVTAALNIGFCVSTAQADIFPAYGADPSANIVITFAADGSISTVDNGFGPYDGIDGTYIGIINNSTSTIYSLDLSSNLPIAAFDRDGLAAYLAPTPYDGYGYGGPQGYFTNLTLWGTSATINFVGGVAPGSSTYFSLEAPVYINVAAAPEPATWALMIVGVGSMGAALRTRRRKVAA